MASPTNTRVPTLARSFSRRAWASTLPIWVWPPRQSIRDISAPSRDGSAIHGNSVLGHSLEGTPGPGKPGVIGRLLTQEERLDLIEYLKTL